MPLSPSLRAAAWLAALSFTSGGVVHAADLLSNGAGLYAGGTLGVAGVTPNGLKSTSRQDGDGQASGGVFAGARLATLPVAEGWPLYLEVAYQDIARSTLRYRVQNTTSDLSASGYALSAAARLSVPLTAHFGLHGKLGASYAKVDGSTPAGQPVITVKGSGSGVVSAFGLEYQYASGPVLRGEITRYSRVSPQAGAAAINLGLGFQFR